MSDYLFSKSTGGFYVADIHGDGVPADAVGITKEQHAAMLDGQSAGKVIGADSKGFPKLVDASSAPQLKTRFTSLEYLDRFTDAEQLAVVTATMQSAPVKLWYDRLLAASFVDLNDPRTALGLDALIAGGLLNASRKVALLTPA